MNTLTWDDLVNKLHLNIDNVRDFSTRAHPTFVPKLPSIIISNELANCLDEHYKSNTNLYTIPIIKESLKISGFSKKLCFDSHLNLTNYIDSNDSDDEEIEGFILVFGKNEQRSLTITTNSHDKVLIRTISLMDSLRNKENSIYAIISYEFYWEFYFMDNYGKVYSGGQWVSIDRPPSGFSNSIGVAKILSWIVWILQNI